MNIKNTDNRCILWRHVTYLYYFTKGGINGQQRIKKEDKLTANSPDYYGIDFPVKIADIPTTEERHNLKIMVFGYKHTKDAPYLIYVDITPTTSTMVSYFWRMAFAIH